MAGGTTTHYVYGLGGLLYGEYDNAGVLIREYVWLNGEPLAQIDKNGGSEAVLYLHTDHLATSRFASDSAGAQVWSWDSGAFGKEVPTGTATVNLRFPGQYYDSESTLHYNWNRFYNPATGRYISSDPIGLAGGLNTFGYALQSPVVYYDPDGQQIAETIGGCLILGGALAGWYGLTCTLNPDQVICFPSDQGSNQQEQYPQSLPNTADDPPVSTPGESGADGTKESGEDGKKKRDRTPEPWLPEEGSDSTAGAGAAGEVPDLGGKSKGEAEEELKTAGFKEKATTADGVTRWDHPDGSRIFVYPDGRISRQAPKVQNPDPNGAGYRPRVGPDGKIFYGADHNTGEKIQ